MPVEVMAELGGDDPCIPLPFDRLADQRLRQMVAIALGPVDQVDAEILGTRHQIADLLR